MIIARNLKNCTLRKKKEGNDKRKATYVFSRLEDGVHAGTTLQNKITTKVVNACKLVAIPSPKPVSKITSIRGHTTENLRSESEIEPWQLKRTKYQSKK